MLKKVIALLLSISLSACYMGTIVSADSSDKTIFVATDGSDSNNGSIDSPVATLMKARDLARNAGTGAVIALRAGTYEENETLELDSKDSGLTVRPYKDEKVVISGANNLSYSDFSKVTDEAVLSRIVTKSARDKVVSVDLKKLGITNYGKIKATGRGECYEDTGFSTVLYIDNVMQTIARYPNNDYLMVSEVVDPGSTPRNGDTELKGFKFRVADNRMENWKNAEDPMAFGYWMHDWAEGRVRVTFDYAQKNLISSNRPSQYGIAAQRRFYFFNLLEELDAEGEWYMDQESGILYMIPPKTCNASSKIQMVVNDKIFVNIKGAENITIKGITFEKNLASAVYAKDVKGLTIADCEFSYICDSVATIYGTNCSVVSNHFHDIGGRAVYMEGGDRDTLTGANNVITNNILERFQQISKTGVYGFHMVGCGGTISHNIVRECASIAILYFGNDFTVEYNDVSKACMETADQGAIYSGRSPVSRGNKIRYNYIHDMKIIDTKTPYTIQGVYLDDMHSSTEVYGNIFYNLVAVALYGGGRNNTFVNNIMIDCSQPFTMDHRGLDWMDTSENSQYLQNLRAVPYTSDIWLQRFPELKTLMQDDFRVPKYNVIKNNVMYNTPDFNLAPEVKEFGTIENNITVSSNKIFKGYGKKDFNLVEGCEVYTKIPDWENIPIEKIGLLNDSVSAIEKGSVSLLIGSPFAIAKGTKTMVDTSDESVQPVIIDGRTLVPVRFIAESFGAEVGWDGATKTVSISSASNSITLTLGSTEMNVNGKVTALDVPAQVISDRTVVPMRAIAEALGKTVFWDPKGLIVMSDADLGIADDTFTVDSIIRHISVR